MGAVDQGAGAANAAMAHRQDRRHPAVQERSRSRRQIDTIVALGGRRRAEGRHQRHAGAKKSPTTRVEAWRTDGRPARTRHPPPDLHDGRQDAGQVVGALLATGLTEASLGTRRRDPHGNIKGRKSSITRLRSLKQDDHHRRDDDARGRRQAIAARTVPGMGHRQDGRRLPSGRAGCSSPARGSASTFTSHAMGGRDRPSGAGRLFLPER